MDKIAETLERLKRNGILKPISISKSKNIIENSQIKVKCINKIEHIVMTADKLSKKVDNKTDDSANNDTDEPCLRCRNCGIKLEDNSEEIIASIETLVCMKCAVKDEITIIENEELVIEYLEDDEITIQNPNDYANLKVSETLNKSIKFYFCTECRRNYSSLEHLKDHGYHVHFVRQRHRNVKRPRKKRLTTPFYSIVKHDQNYILLVTHPVFNEDQHKKLPTKDEITEMLSNYQYFDFGKFNCPKCPEVFSSFDQMQNHLVHIEHAINDGSLMCHLCNDHFKSWLLLQKHFASIHPTNNEMDEDQLSFQEFIETFGSDDDDDDDDEYDERVLFTDLNDSVKKSTGKNDNDYNCEEPTEEEWLNNEDGSGECSTCSYCNEKFNTKLLKAVHEQFKHQVMNKMDTSSDPIVGEKKICCELCGQYFVNKRTLSRHLLFKHHTTNKTDEYRCRLCPAIFASSTLRTKHERKIHANPLTYQYECEKCNKSYQRPELLKSHWTSHDGIKNHICDQCGRSFALEKYLKQHRVLHFQNEEHVCDQCQRVFKNAYNLTKHMHVHNPTSRKKCYQCEKTFADPRDLQRHLFSHGNYEKEFQCNLCSFKAYIKTDLSRHFRTIHRKFQPEHKTRAPII